MESHLQQVSLNLIASAKLPVEPWNLLEWLSALEQGKVPDMMVYGLDGYGVDNNGLHYYLNQGGLAVFLQFS